MGNHWHTLAWIEIIRLRLSGNPLWNRGQIDCLVEICVLHFVIYRNISHFEYYNQNCTIRGSRWIQSSKSMGCIEAWIPSIVKIVCRGSREEGNRNLHGSLTIVDWFSSFFGSGSRLRSRLYSVAFFNLQVIAIMLKFWNIARLVECRQPIFDWYAENLLQFVNVFAKLKEIDSGRLCHMEVTCFQVEGIYSQAPKLAVKVY